MKLALVQLSDIHFKAPEDPALQRLPKIVDAVAAHSDACDALCVAVTGDIAQSGQESEYLIAVDFFELLRRSLTERTKLPVHVVLVPGNHDCDFSAPTEARDLIIKDLDPLVRPTRDMIACCTKLQSAYFSFQQLICELPDLKHNPLCSHHVLTVGTEKVLFRCLNSAWVSQLHEQPSGLVLPPDHIEAGDGEYAISISMLHHPYNWYRPPNHRTLRDRLEEVSDIILTGHEHEGTAKNQNLATGETNLYIEGDVLQERDNPASSGFNLVLLDTQTRRQKIIRFNWNENHYASAMGEWTEYHTNRLRADHVFSVTRTFEEHLDDPGIQIEHPSHGRLKLDDIFVPLDLHEFTLRGRDNTRLLTSEDLLRLSETAPRILLTGAEKSGKTCLSKRLFKAFLDAGHVPLLLHGDDLRENSDKWFDSAIKKAFTGQYGEALLEKYRQLPPTRRVLIVDDYHRAKARKRTLRETLARLTKWAGRVLLLATDLVEQTSELISGDILPDENALETYVIRPMGHLRRDELAQKWYAHDDAVRSDPARLARKLVETKRIMDTAIGRNFVPAFPVFMIPILQTIGNNRQIDTNASTYGYYYELLIRQALARGTSHAGFDFRVAYLSFIAYSMHAGGLTEASEEALHGFHREYCDKYAVDPSFSKNLTELVETGILSESDGAYRFSYDYYYNYFVASFIRDHIDDASTQDEIRRLSKGLHEERAANILLFLAHLSRNSIVINEMLATARTLFADSNRYGLEPDESPLATVTENFGSYEYVERSVLDSRRDQLARLDAKERLADESDFEAATTELATIAGRLSTAFKVLQILGQVLKNFPGSLERDSKMAIAEECYGIGLRTLGHLFGLLQSSADGIVRNVIETVRGRDDAPSTEEIAEQARQSLAALAHMIAHGMISRTSISVGSPNLGPIYSQMRDKHPTASDALIYIALRLEQQADFPAREVEELAKVLEQSSNHLGLAVLKSLVMAHFHTFEVPYRTKQAICARLHIPYRQLTVKEKRQRLVAKSN